MLFQESKNRADVMKSTAKALNSSVGLISIYLFRISSCILSRQAEARKDALRRSPGYKAYLTRLVTIGYFRNEIEGSQLWNELENKAADAYVEIRRQEYVHVLRVVRWLIKSFFASDMSRPSFAALFNAALFRAPETLSDVDIVQTEDSDEWMNVDASDFDEVLDRAMYAGGSTEDTHAMETDGDGGKEDRITKDQTNKLRDLAAKVEQFVEGKGDVDGARFEEYAFASFYSVISASNTSFHPRDCSEAFSDEDDADSDDDEALFSDERFYDSDDQESDAETRKARDAVRQKAMDNLVPALPASEYGQMPASFNTQRVAKTTILTEQVETGLPEDTTPSETAGREPSSPVHIRPIRPPLLPRDKYEGVDSDDESSSSDPFAGGDDEDDESEEDRPQVVGEIEVDMNEEQAEFLEFSRQALGISDDMWNDIIKERRGRGGVYLWALDTWKDG